MSTARFCSCTVGSSQAINCTESALSKQAVLTESACCNWHVPSDQTAPRPFITPLPTYVRLCPGGRCCQVTLRTRTKCYKPPGTPRPFSQTLEREARGEGGARVEGVAWALREVSTVWSLEKNIGHFSYPLTMWILKNPQTKTSHIQVRCSPL